MNALEARRAFIKEFHGMCHRWNSWDVWSDWLVMASSSIYNAIHRDPDVEAEYMKVAGKYNADEMATMARLLGITAEALGAEIHDFLGAVFHELEMHNKHIGQFFTPFELCKMMAAMMAPPVPRPGILLQVGEPAAGSGSMVLAFAEIMREAECPQAQILYHLKDLDHRAFRMSYIQTSLCGLPAEVVLGDTLRGTTDRVWRTPGYYLHDIATRLRVDAMMRALQPGEDDANEPEHSLACESPAAGRARVPTGLHAVSVGEALEEIHLEAPSPTADLDEDAKAPEDAKPPVPDLILPRPGEHFSLF